MSSKTYDAIIIGAGIVGSACAAECAREGLSDSLPRTRTTTPMMRTAAARRPYLLRPFKLSKNIRSGGACIALHESPLREREEIFAQGKLVIAITCSVHATEIGATQMAVELVHRLATDGSPQVKKIVDNVIFLLVPSLNPDGQVMVTDWFNKNLGTPYESSPLPYLIERARNLADQDFLSLLKHVLPEGALTSNTGN